MRGHQQDSTILFITTFAFLISFSLAQCYKPDGDPGRDEYEPCNDYADSNNVRMCCATNRSNPFLGPLDNGITADECLPNGFCINVSLVENTDGSVENRTAYWRGLCTASTWKEGCLPVCTDTSENGYESSPVRMTACDKGPDSETWCCGTDNSDCCNSDSAFTIPANFGDPFPSSTVSPGLSDGAKTGIGVGVAMGVIAIIAAGVAFWYIRRRRRRNAAAAANDNANTNTDMAVVGAAVAVPAPPYQAHTTVQSPQKLEGNGLGNRVGKPAGTGDVRHELSGESAGGGHSAH